MEKRRSFGIELLRIICMILIVTGHYYVHGGFLEFNTSNIVNAP